MYDMSPVYGILAAVAFGAMVGTFVGYLWGRSRRD